MKYDLSSWNQSSFKAGDSYVNQRFSKIDELYSSFNNKSEV